MEDGEKKEATSGERESSFLSDAAAALPCPAWLATLGPRGRRPRSQTHNLRICVLYSACRVSFFLLLPGLRRAVGHSSERHPCRLPLMSSALHGSSMGFVHGKGSRLRVARYVAQSLEILTVQRSDWRRRPRHSTSAQQITSRCLWSRVRESRGQERRRRPCNA